MKIKRNAKPVIALLFCATLLSNCLFVPSQQEEDGSSLPQVSTTPVVTDTTMESTQHTDLWLTRDCIELSPMLGRIPDAMIVMQDYASRNIALYDLRDGIHIPLDGEVYYEMSVSPDYKQLAYVSVESGFLHVFSASGMQQENISAGGSWAGVVEWLTNDILLLQKFIEPYWSASSAIYNLETGEFHELPAEYPDIRSTRQLQWGNHIYTWKIYDPTLSRVVYPGVGEANYSTLVLYDLETNRKVAEFYQGDSVALASAPQWSRDGAYFVAAFSPQYQIGDTTYENFPDGQPYEGGFDLYQVRRDGNTRRLTYLSTLQSAGEEAFSLSPDGKHLAFWLVLDYGVGHVSDATRSLATLDLESGAITDYCIPGGAHVINPIWSPDGRYLVITRDDVANVVSEVQFPDVILVDLDLKTSTRIAEGAVSKGWMVK